MSNMFLGTALTQPIGGGPNANSQSNSIPATIEELDRPSNCPENVDSDSWAVFCGLRRRKIESEKSIAAAVAELTETEESVEEREEAAEKTASAVIEATERLKEWRLRKNSLINDLEIVLTLPR